MHFKAAAAAATAAALWSVEKETKEKEIKKLNKRRPFELNRIWQRDMQYTYYIVYTIYRDDQKGAACKMQ